jgi:hypothetical protein
MWSCVQQLSPFLKLETIHLIDQPGPIHSDQLSNFGYCTALQELRIVFAGDGTEQVRTVRVDTHMSECCVSLAAQYVHQCIVHLFSTVHSYFSGKFLLIWCTVFSAFELVIDVL